ncbi:MAG: BrnA antitoxin family protein [Rhodospirillales bacterium]|nr:BrnA antitoxin family protein [Rhodospirillales bacterium]
MTQAFFVYTRGAFAPETLKATGKGWLTRVNAALRQFITEHQGR